MSSINSVWNGYTNRGGRKKTMSIEGDIVLIHIKEQPAIYARIEEIEPDIKKGWYRVTLLLLSIPSQAITWILKEEYINGVTFTMDGNPVMLEEIKKTPLQPPAKEGEPTVGDKAPASKGKILPFKSITK
jgi:hypothetical protein